MDDEALDGEVGEWYRKRTFVGGTHDARELAAIKVERGLRVTVCLPALNEEETIGSICEKIAGRLQGDADLVDDLICIDSGSDDRTAEVAAVAGARVIHAGDVAPDALPPEVSGGKGAAIWKSLHVAQGDLIVWLDSDTKNFSESFVVDLLAPLVESDDLVLTKGFYHRPLVTEAGALRTGGARVTELLVRPMLHLFRRSLTGFVQPLSGEYAGRLHVLRRLPFWSGYAVDLGLLLELEEAVGLHGMAQVDLGVRVHRNQEVPALGRMAFQLLRMMFLKLEEQGRLRTTHDLPASLTQFLPAWGGDETPGEERPEAVRFDLDVVRLPPAARFLS